MTGTAPAPAPAPPRPITPDTLWGNFVYLNQRISDYGRDFYWDLDLGRNAQTRNRSLTLRKRMQVPHIFSAEEVQKLTYSGKDKKIFDQLICKYRTGYSNKTGYYKYNILDDLRRDANGAKRRFVSNLRGDPIDLSTGKILETREVYPATTLFFYMGIIGIMIAYIIHAVIVDRMITTAYTKTDEEFKKQRGFPRKFYILLYYLLLIIIFMCVLLVSGYLIELLRNWLASNILFPLTSKEFRHNVSRVRKRENTRDLKAFQGMDGIGGKIVFLFFSIFSCILCFTFLYLLWHMVKDDRTQTIFLSCFGVLSALICAGLVVFYI